jgi:hypothetical protein
MNATSIQKPIAPEFEDSILYQRLRAAEEGPFYIRLLADKAKAQDRAETLQLFFDEIARDGLRGDKYSRLFDFVVVAIQEANRDEKVPAFADDQAMLASATWALGVAKAFDKVAGRKKLWDCAIGHVVTAWAGVTDRQTSEKLLASLLTRAMDQRCAKSIADAIRKSEADFVRAAEQRPVIARIANNVDDPFTKEAALIVNALDHLIKAGQDETVRARDAQLVPGLAVISKESYERVLAAMRREQELTNILHELIAKTAPEMGRDLNQRCLKGEVKYDHGQPYMFLCYDEDDNGAIVFGDEDFADQSQLRSWARHDVMQRAPDGLRTVVAYKKEGKVKIIASNH